MEGKVVYTEEEMNISCRQKDLVQILAKVIKIGAFWS